MRQWDRFEATFRPQREDDLKPGAKALIGRRLGWEAVWVIEADDNRDYEGQLACMLVTDLGAYPGFAWVPECDLADITPLGEGWDIALSPEQVRTL